MRTMRTDYPKMIFLIFFIGVYCVPMVNGNTADDNNTSLVTTTKTTPEENNSNLTLLDKITPTHTAIISATLTQLVETIPVEPKTVTSIGTDVISSTPMFWDTSIGTSKWHWDFGEGIILGSTERNPTLSPYIFTN